MGDLLAMVQPEDLLKYGLIPEFVGRLPVVATLHDLDEQALMRILREPKNAILKQYQKYFELERVRLKFTDDAVAAVAREAMKRGTGARGLRAVLEEAMLDIMYEVPSIPGLKECMITREVILNGPSHPDLGAEGAVGLAGARRASGAELLVHRHPVAIGERVRLAGHADHRHQFRRIASDIPALRAAAVCEAMQYPHWLEALTAR